MSEQSTLYEQVMATADRLAKEGKRPTIKAVKAEIAGPASYNQIAKYLRLWRRAREGRFCSTSLISSQDPISALEVPAVQKSAHELEQSFALVRATLESTVDGILIVSSEGELVDWNQQFIEVMDVPEAVLKSRDETGGIQHLLEKVDNPKALYKEIMFYMKNPEAKGNLGEIKFRDGRIIERYSQPHVVHGEIVGRVWSFRDITERKRAEEQMLLQSQAIEASPNGIFILDVLEADWPIIYVNPAFVQITGLPSQEVLNRPNGLYQIGRANTAKIQKIKAAIDNEQTEHVVLHAQRRNGDYYWCKLEVAPVFINQGEVRYFVGICVDITKRIEMERQLEHQSTHDSLTSLPNRALLWDRLKQSILYAKRRDWTIAVMFIDLDRFKIINDGLGHLLGDELLKEVAKRLLAVIRDSDTAARLGGDEFVVMLPNINSEKHAVTCAFRALTQIAKPYYIRGQEINITGSVGICFYPKDGSSVEELLKNADMSMYKAKEQGRNNFQFYTPSWDRQMTRRIKVENWLFSALNQDEMALYYQPIYSVNEARFTGCEALLRWHHPEMGYVSPGEFIPLAEENGLIHTLGKWVMRSTCLACKRFEAQGFHNLFFTMNMSAQELQRHDIIESVQTVIEETQMDPAKLEIELTESIVMHDIDQAIETMNQLKALGVKLAIDDFGKEYSSLSYLLKMPVDSLKIDLSFTSAVLNSQNGQSIIKTILSLGDNLGLDVIVEGVEFNQQYQFFLKHGFDLLQGFFLARPMPENQLTEFFSHFVT